MNKDNIGGGWIINAQDPNSVYIPEEFTEEQLSIQGMANQFLEKEILPLSKRIDNLEPGLMKSLLEKAGEQGLLSVSIPEKYNGLGKDLITATIINEQLGAGFSFSVAFAAHSGIGTLPILYFGTESQKEKYIPKLAVAEFVGAYGLTEPQSGSDALGAKTIAVLSEDKKHYILNGQKCWITNGGISEIYTIFAKIDGDKFTAFIIERGTEGFTQGQEEHKLGIKGSSTVQLFFQDCKVPVENVLGEIGKGHLIAFNILNLGRLKLGAGALGAAKSIFKISLLYAQNRIQFKVPIASFGAMKHKLAEMYIKTWVCESLVYRLTNDIQLKEHNLLKEGKTFNEATLGGADEFSIECSIAKIFGSEVLNYVVDEGVQIHGGNGFSDEYLISKAYRDSRINRIFEGTNEINRLLIVDMFIKRALAGRLDLLTAATNVQKELLSVPNFNDSNDNQFCNEELLLIENFKKAFLMVAGAAVQTLMTALSKEQEIVMNISDIAIEIYTAESALLRLIKLHNQFAENKNYDLEYHIVKTYIYDASFKINKYGNDAINGFATGDQLRMMLVGLKRFTKINPYNTKEARRKIMETIS